MKRFETLITSKITLFTRDAVRDRMGSRDINSTRCSSAVNDENFLLHVNTQGWRETQDIHAEKQKMISFNTSNNIEIFTLYVLYQTKSEIKESRILE